MPAKPRPEPQKKKRSSRREGKLAEWLAVILHLCSIEPQNLSSDHIHDLRVSLRRSRSLADALMSVDADSVWRKLDKRARKLFKRLGKLRTTQVTIDWAKRMIPDSDPLHGRLLQRLEHEEQRQKILATEALQDFDRKRWTKWVRTLPKKAAPVLQDRPLCLGLSMLRLEDLQKAHHLSAQSREVEDLHRTRIRLKRFRYTVEHFLPDFYEEWEADLKQLQDVLGEMNDLFELDKAMDEPAYALYRTRLSKEIDLRITQYLRLSGLRGPLYRRYYRQLESTLKRLTRELPLDRTSGQIVKQDNA